MAILYIDTYFYNSAPKVFAETSKSLVRGFSIKENVRVDFIENDFMRITAKNKCVVIAECKNAENVFENKEDCDIIILYGKNISEYEDLIKENQEGVQIIVLVFICLALALSNDQQAYIAFCFTVALITSGIIGGIARNQQLAYIIFWTIFLFLASFLIFEDVYQKIWAKIVDFIKLQLDK